jgi:hypothetical protein
MRIFFLFAFGMATHYVLDVLLIHVSGGLALLWLLSWQTWALQLVQPDHWLGTTILVAAAIIVWLVLQVGTVVISESEAHAYHPQRRVMTVLECS